MTLTAADPVLVIGAGIMGAGIVQVAAPAGHRVMPFMINFISGTGLKKCMPRTRSALP